VGKTSANKIFGIGDSVHGSERPRDLCGDCVVVEMQGRLMNDEGHIAVRRGRNR
jgi:hypothetical protein